MLKYKITETINYCLDLSCITPQETNAIHSLYKHFSTLLLEEFNCTPKNKGSKIFYLAFNYGSLNGTWSVNLNTSNLNAGMYLVELTINGTKVTKRLIVE